MALGFPIGALVVAPLYAAEAAAKEDRGRVMSGFSLGVTGGILAATVAATAARSAPHGWLLVVGPLAVLGLGCAAGILACPESPRWLVP